MSDLLSPRSGIRLDDTQRLAWLRLVRSESVGPATFRDLINYFGTASAALDALPDLAARAKSGKRITIASEDQAAQELEALSQLNGQVICLGEPDYPAALRAVDAPPPVISVIGNPMIFAENTVAFVGSRNASLSGIKLTGQLASETGKSGFATVSGLARGIDAAAHHASIETGTIAVFAGGVDHIYPRENAELAQAIVANSGAIVSEMPLGWQPRAQDFPRRNRIVAGIALGLVVVEAAKRSGSLISARLANEMGRIVFAVPGSPLDPRSEGANHLIKQGATLITSARDIVETLSPLRDINMQSAYTLEEGERQPLDANPSDSERQRLIDALDRTPVHVDEIVRFTNIEAANLHMLLLELDLAGRLERHPGNKVSII
ncbi:DNA-processing protein DprA [Pseudahrensia aquimaris]|uniref:DNA-processing protein DprA n=1 Tax=Pseudahrensia aquimaris TaxID=744461 RepID=A0ABW3FJS6_9HYPH